MYPAALDRKVFNGPFLSPKTNCNCHTRTEKRVTRKRVSAATINYDLPGWIETVPNERGKCPIEDQQMMPTIAETNPSSGISLSNGSTRPSAAFSDAPPRIHRVLTNAL